MAHKIFLGFGVVTTLSGMALVFMEDYISGVCGGIVGLWIVWENLKKIKSKK